MFRYFARYNKDLFVPEFNQPKESVIDVKTKTLNPPKKYKIAKSPKIKMGAVSPKINRNIEKESVDKTITNWVFCDSQ